MANKKRDPATYIKKMKCHRVERNDLLAIEKILRIYADPREMKSDDASSAQVGTKSNLKVVKRYVSIGRFRPPSISFWPGYSSRVYAGTDWIDIGTSIRGLKKGRYPFRTSRLKLSAWPGIYVAFTPRKTTIFAQTHNASGEDLRALKEVADKIENYISGMQESSLNSIRLKEKLIGM